jgi:hypothetical protein
MGGAPLLEIGVACSESSACESCECVDGVCCESACADLCFACVAAQTGATDGACAPVSADTDPAAECDDALGCGTGTCDGDGACGIRPAETLCRASAGLCDTAEVCDGVSAECPADEVVPAGLSCRPAASACDIEEVCDGLAPECPSNQVLGAGNTCGAYQCSGTSDLCPTSCSSDAGCADDNVCLAGQCQPGRRVFITSGADDGNLGGLDGGDLFCQTLANAANLEGTYRMWLSDATGSPSTRFDQSSVPYYRLDGVMVASSYADLIDGSLSAPINVSDTGVTVASNVPFTGTLTDGTAFAPAFPGSSNCSGWTSASSAQHAMAGQSEGADGTWTQSSNSGAPRQCNVLHRFYCFEQ